MARNGRIGGTDRGIGLVTGRGIGQAIGICIEETGREAMTEEERMRGCLDDIGNEASRQAHTDEEDTPETGITITEDEIWDQVAHSSTASSIQKIPLWC